MKLLAISGSLRAKSTNTSLLRAAQRLAPPGVEIVLYQGLGELPHFNTDLDVASLATVGELTARVAAADGLLISSPEYAFGVPGSLKNALDWLVGGDGFVYKPFALLGASPRATTSRESLLRTLTAMSGRIVGEASITLPLLGTNLDEAGIVAHAEFGPKLKTAIEAFVRALTP